MSTGLNVLTIGGSRNIGYFSSVRFLDAGATVTFLLRSPSTFDNDPIIQKYVKEDKARLVKGDALVKEDVQRVWDEAGKDTPVDVLLFSVGGMVQFNLSKGFYLDPPNLVTQSLLNTLSTLPRSQSVQPRIVVISSTGLTEASHASIPLAIKPIYSYMLPSPHKDKVGAEQIVAHVAGWSLDPAKKGVEPGEDIMGPGDWKSREGLSDLEAALKKVLVVRPALLMGEECVADKYKEQGKSKEPYRVSTKDFKSYSISRKDVAHFVAEAVLTRWDEFEGQAVNIGY